MFVFQEPPRGKSSRDERRRRQTEKADAGRVAELEKELAYTRESLQATVEEVQATNEELRSANEEMQSTNEEMQSTNEELETSKEELQSVNEELMTVNSELQSKIDQLSRSESDMKNLLDSTEIATIFLDGDLHIKRFTASATRVISLIATDVGRPIGDVTVKIEYAAIAEKAQEVLDRLRPFEAEVKAKDHQWFLMRIAAVQDARQRDRRGRHHLYRHHGVEAGSQGKGGICREYRPDGAGAASGPRRRPSGGYGEQGLLHPFPRQPGRDRGPRHQGPGRARVGLSPS